MTARSALGRAVVPGARNTKVSDRIAQLIVADILRNGYGPGHVLPSERQMLDAFGVGRTTLREALRLLETQGVLAIRVGPKGGPVVQHLTSGPITNHLAVVLRFGGSTFGEILQAREALEPVVAGIAAPRMTDEDIAELQETVDLVRANPHDHHVFTEQTWLFHSKVAECSGNLALKTFTESLHAISQGTPIGVVSDEKRRIRTASIHERIIGELVKRNAADAEASMRHHMVDFRKFVERQYPELKDQVIISPAQGY